MIFTTCGTEDGDPTPQSTIPVITDSGTPIGTASSSSIGAAGGTVQSSDGMLTVVIPPGALPGNTTISVQPITNEGPLGVGLGYRLQPEGVTFNEPVTLKFSYDEQLLNGLPADFLWIVTQAGNGSWNALLKSKLDTGAKTVSIETTHFSDWALGKFIDLSLSPKSATLLKDQSVELRVSGFVRDQALSEEEELAPLIPITTDEDALTPLTPIPSVESRLVDFRVKQWTLNGVSAPVSNTNGSLSASRNNATYTAPGKKPTSNPVAVSVSLEANDKDGKKKGYLLTSSISIVDSDLYLLMKIDGQAYEYIQYGLNGAIPPDPNDIWMANCSFGDNSLAIFGSQFVNSTDLKNGFGLEIQNPSEGSITLDCFNGNGTGDMEFIFGVGGPVFGNSYVHRTLVNDTCMDDYLCSSITVTLLSYTGESGSIVTGYFSGKLYEDKPGYFAQCKSSDEHIIEGEFRLSLVK
jgi:hypothetical protein